MSQNAVRENFASLVNGKVPESQLPSYVDDVLEYDNKSAFPATGETGKIYVDKSTNLTYRWSGSTYIQVGGGDLNLENGEGLYSLAQIRVSTEGEPRKCKAYQKTTVALGGNTQAGMTFEEWKVINPDGTQEEYDYIHSFAFAHGQSTKALGGASHSEGNLTVANGVMSHAEGSETHSNGKGSHSEGNNTISDGNFSHSEGDNTRAIGFASHSEGSGTKATALFAHSEGDSTEASAHASHSEGYHTKATHIGQTVCGRYNVGVADTLFEVGNGESDADRKNAFEVLKDGRAKVQSAPVEGDDVVRKIEFDTKLDSSEFSVLTQEQVDLLF